MQGNCESSIMQVLQKSINGKQREVVPENCGISPLFFKTKVR